MNFATNTQSLSSLLPVAGRIVVILALVAAANGASHAVDWYKAGALSYAHTTQAAANYTDDYRQGALSFAHVFPQSQDRSDR